MTITTYQMDNVLRAYGKQLSLGRRAARNKEVARPKCSDSITISAEGRRRAIIEKVTADVVEKITRYGPRDGIEQKVFKQLEDEYGNKLELKEDNSGQLFRVVDRESGEATKTLSIDDSRFLKNRLEEITKNEVDANMF